MRRKRRKRPIRMKDGQLSASYGYLPDGGEDLYFTNGPGCHQGDRALLAYAFENVPVYDGKGLRKVLIDRGYDIRTLRFTIDKIKAPTESTKKDGN
jgi:hypothetical protein